MRPFTHPQVAAKFDAYPTKARTGLLALRELVFQVAATTDGAGEVDETLKWGEPAYATRNGNGSTIRMDWKPKHPDQYAMYFNCQTHLVESFRAMFPHDFRFEGNRALVFPLDAKIPKDALAMCIAASLTYHVRKKAEAPAAKRSRRSDAPSASSSPSWHKD